MIYWVERSYLSGQDCKIVEVAPGRDEYLSGPFTSYNDAAHWAHQYEARCKRKYHFVNALLWSSVFLITASIIYIARGFV